MGRPPLTGLEVTRTEVRRPLPASNDPQPALTEALKDLGSMTPARYVETVLDVPNVDYIQVFRLLAGKRMGVTRLLAGEDHAGLEDRLIAICGAGQYHLVPVWNGYFRGPKLEVQVGGAESIQSPRAGEDVDVALAATLKRIQSIQSIKALAALNDEGPKGEDMKTGEVIEVLKLAHAAAPRADDQTAMWKLILEMQQRAHEAQQAHQKQLLDLVLAQQKPKGDAPSWLSIVPTILETLGKRAPAALDHVLRGGIGDNPPEAAPGWGPKDVIEVVQTAAQVLPLLIQSAGPLFRQAVAGAARPVPVTVTPGRGPEAPALPANGGGDATMPIKLEPETAAAAQYIVRKVTAGTEADYRAAWAAIKSTPQLAPFAMMIDPAAGDPEAYFFTLQAVAPEVVQLREQALSFLAWVMQERARELEEDRAAEIAERALQSGH